MYNKVDRFLNHTLIHYQHEQITEIVIKMKKLAWSIQRTNEQSPHRNEQNREILDFLFFVYQKLHIA